MSAYLYSMVLSFKELKKREVVNIADGRSFGHIVDLKIDFPCATLKGIVVSDKTRGGLLGLFCKSEIFIDEKQIVRIGGDVILVNIKHCEAITPAVVDINSNNAKANCNVKKDQRQSAPSLPPCPPVSPCPPVAPCPPPEVPCPPPFNPCGTNQSVTQLSSDEQDLRIDFEDY